MKRLKTTQIPIARKKLLKAQGGVCPLCLNKLGGRGKQPALDHCHTTGYIRDVLCLNCNGIEGRIFNLTRRAKGRLATALWLTNLVEYYKRHESPQHGGWFHPTHKTEAEKRLARNTKARKAREKK